MSYPLPARAFAGLVALAALSAGAQTPAAPGHYQSAFEGYQPYSDDKVRPWKESNDNVGQIGGWRAYAREAQGGQPAPVNGPAVVSPPAAAGPAAADPHAGHGKH